VAISALQTELKHLKSEVKKLKEECGKPLKEGELAAVKKFEAKVSEKLASDSAHKAIEAAVSAAARNVNLARTEEVAQRTAKRLIDKALGQGAAKQIEENQRSIKKMNEESTNLRREMKEVTRRTIAVENALAAQKRTDQTSRPSTPRGGNSGPSTPRNLHLGQLPPASSPRRGLSQDEASLEPRVAMVEAHIESLQREQARSQTQQQQQQQQPTGTPTVTAVAVSTPSQHAGQAGGAPVEGVLSSSVEELRCFMKRKFHDFDVERHEAMRETRSSCSAVQENLIASNTKLQHQLAAASRDLEHGAQRLAKRIAAVEGHLEEGKLLERVAEAQGGLSNLKKVEARLTGLGEATTEAYASLQRQLASETQRRAGLESEVGSLSHHLHARMEARVATCVERSSPAPAAGLGTPPSNPEAKPSGEAYDMGVDIELNLLRERLGLIEARLSEEINGMDAKVADCTLWKLAHAALEAELREERLVGEERTAAIESLARSVHLEVGKLSSGMESLGTGRSCREQAMEEQIEELHRTKAPKSLGEEFEASIQRLEAAVEVLQSGKADVSFVHNQLATIDQLGTSQLFPEGPISPWQRECCASEPSETEEGPPSLGPWEGVDVPIRLDNPDQPRRYMSAKYAGGGSPHKDDMVMLEEWRRQAEARMAEWRRQIMQALSRTQKDGGRDLKTLEAVKQAESKLASQTAMVASLTSRLATLEGEARGGLRTITERLGNETGQRERSEWNAEGRLNARVESVLSETLAMRDAMESRLSQHHATGHEAEGRLDQMRLLLQNIVQEVEETKEQMAVGNQRKEHAMEELVVSVSTLQAEGDEMRLQLHQLEVGQDQVRSEVAEGLSSALGGFREAFKELVADEAQATFPDAKGLVEDALKELSREMEAAKANLRDDSLALWGKLEESQASCLAEVKNDLAEWGGAFALLEGLVGQSIAETRALRDQSAAAMQQGQSFTGSGQSPNTASGGRGDEDSRPSPGVRAALVVNERVTETGQAVAALHSNQSEAAQERVEIMEHTRWATKQQAQALAQLREQIDSWVHAISDLTNRTLRLEQLEVIGSTQSQELSTMAENVVDRRLELQRLSGKVVTKELLEARLSQHTVEVDAIRGGKGQAAAEARRELGDMAEQAAKSAAEEALTASWAPVKDELEATVKRLDSEVAGLGTRLSEAGAKARAAQNQLEELQWNLEAHQESLQSKNKGLPDLERRMAESESESRRRLTKAESKIKKLETATKAAAEGHGLVSPPREVEALKSQLVEASERLLVVETAVATKAEDRKLGEGLEAMQMKLAGLEEDAREAAKGEISGIEKDKAQDQLMEQNAARLHRIEGKVIALEAAVGDASLGFGFASPLGDMSPKRREVEEPARPPKLQPAKPPSPPSNLRQPKVAVKSEPTAVVKRWAVDELGPCRVCGGSGLPGSSPPRCAACCPAAAAAAAAAGETGPQLSSPDPLSPVDGRRVVNQGFGSGTATGRAGSGKEEMSHTAGVIAKQRKGEYSTPPGESKIPSPPVSPLEAYSHVEAKVSTRTPLEDKKVKRRISLGKSEAEEESVRLQIRAQGEAEALVKARQDAKASQDREAMEAEMARVSQAPPSPPLLSVDPGKEAAGEAGEKDDARDEQGVWEEEEGEEEEGENEEEDDAVWEEEEEEEDGKLEEEEEEEEEEIGGDETLKQLLKFQPADEQEDEEVVAQEEEEANADGGEGDEEEEDESQPPALEKTLAKPAEGTAGYTFDDWEDL